MCERVVIIHHGRIVARDTIDNLAAGMSGSHKLTFRVAGPQDQALAAVKAIPDVVKVDALGSREEGTAEIYVEARKDHDIRKSVFFAMAKANLPIVRMTSADYSLEDIFVQLTTDEEAS